MRHLIAAAVIATFAAGAIAANDDGLSLLRRFLHNTPAVHIVFRQTALDDNGETLDETGGRFWHRRPHFFRMEYDPPDGIVMVSDGAQIWTYEPDLQQAIVRPAESAAGTSALLDLLSSGDLDSLRNTYILTSGAGGALRWAGAEARDEDQPVRAMRLGFSADGELVLMELKDSFGGTARLRVESIDRTVADDSIFSFTPPAGTDIIREE